MKCTFYSRLVASLLITAIGILMVTSSVSSVKAEDYPLEGTITTNKSVYLRGETVLINVSTTKSITASVELWPGRSQRVQTVLFSIISFEFVFPKDFDQTTLILKDENGTVLANTIIYFVDPPPPSYHQFLALVVH